MGGGGGGGGVGGVGGVKRERENRVLDGDIEVVKRKYY